MIEADLVVAGIGELATPEGRTPRLGKDLDRLRVVQDAAVACRQGRIVFAGPRAECAARVRSLPGACLVDAEGGTVLPGFVDAHTHLPFAGWRERCAAHPGLIRRLWNGRAATIKIKSDRGGNP